MEHCHRYHEVKTNDLLGLDFVFKATSSFVMVRATIVASLRAGWMEFQRVISKVKCVLRGQSKCHLHFPNV